MFTSLSSTNPLSLSLSPLSPLSFLSSLSLSLEYYFQHSALNNSLYNIHFKHLKYMFQEIFPTFLYEICSIFLMITHTQANGIF